MTTDAPKPPAAHATVRLRRMPASALDGSWIGREVMVGGGLVGRLADVDQQPTAHRTVLYLSGDILDIHDQTTITYDTMEATR